MVWTKKLRLAGFPEFFGQDFSLAGYRVLPSGRIGAQVARVENHAERNRQGTNLDAAYRPFGPIRGVPIDNLSRKAKLITKERITMHAVQPSRRPSRKAEIANIVLGVWVAVSPFVLGFQNVAGKWSNVAVGIALVLVALAGAWIDEALEGLVVPLGIWLFASPFVLGFWKGAFLVNNVLLAFAVVTAGAISDGLRSAEEAHRAGVD